VSLENFIILYAKLIIIHHLSCVCLFVFDYMKGARRLQQVRSMVGYKNPQTESDEDSWLNIKDEEDPRGRVGVQWPWSRND
jgi:hypothetical protein